MYSSILKRGSALVVLAAGLSGCVAYYPADPYSPAPGYDYAPPPVAYAPPPVVYPYPAYGSINLNIGGRGYGHGYGRGYGRGYPSRGYSGRGWR